MLLLLGQILHWIYVLSEDLSLVLQCAVMWVPLYPPGVPVLLYCTGVSLAIGHINLICSGHGVVVALDILYFGSILLLLTLMVGLPGWDWGVSYIFP